MYECTVTKFAVVPSVFFTRGFSLYLCICLPLTAVAHYVYFRFIDQGFVLNTYESLLNSLTSHTIPGMDAYVEQFKEIISAMRSLSPTDITMQLMSQNVFYGSLLAIPTALFVMKRPPAEHIGGR